MRVDKLKTNLGDTIKIIFKTKMEYEKWLQYVKDVCITCEKVDPIFQVIPKDLKENATENLDTDYRKSLPELSLVLWNYV